MDISVVIPLYNEEESLPELFSWIERVMEANGFSHEVIFVNVGSTDRSWQVIEELKQQHPDVVKGIKFRRNYGKSPALYCGFQKAEGDVVITMDADLQDPPELVDQMLVYWEEGYDDIYAKRRSRGEESWMRRKLSLAFYKLLQKMSRIDILPNVGDFRLLDRRCILTLRKLREHERYTKGLFCWIGRKASSSTAATA